MQSARSLVILPDSTVSTHAFSSDWAKRARSGVLSSLARCSSPRVHAKIDAIGFVDMSLKRPSYRFRIVFFVDRYSGQRLLSATWNDECAKAVIDSSVLYMASATPGALYLNSSISSTVPSSPVYTIFTVPGLRTT
uniref:Uncharacterized protein n=1 Tax=Anopheles dirus TaxID=7168 RepID=A0A182NXH5_9DIPT